MVTLVGFPQTSWYEEERWRMVPNCVPKNEELSIDQQMKISRDHNRKSPEEKKAANRKALGVVKKVKREKDTRTDAQKMADAYASPRKGPGGARGLID